MKYDIRRRITQRIVAQLTASRRHAVLLPGKSRLRSCLVSKVLSFWDGSFFVFI